MNNKLIIISAVLIILSACNKKEKSSEALASDEYYTCSMDPQVVLYQPGHCPICHMQLIKVKKSNLKEGQIKLSEQQIKLGNITFDTLHVHELAKEISLTGKITVDQNTTEAISAKVQGRVEKLYAKNVGDFISKGQLLYEIYSEDLNVAQEEYLSAISKAPPLEGFGEAARNKMLLYGMSEQQISQLQTSKQILQFVPVYSNADGFVSEISTAEGSYISAGTVLFRIASLNSLWVETQVYLPYLPYLKVGTDATFSIPASGERLFSGKVIFIDPQVQSPNRFVLARFQILNPSTTIKPGMLSDITIQTKKIKTLALPVDAVIENSVGVNVWVRNADGIFENKMVQTGLQNSREVQVTSGLNEGDVVVITGAYLLNSEYVFKRGVSPMSGHHHQHQEEQNMQSMPGMKM